MPKSTSKSRGVTNLITLPVNLPIIGFGLEEDSYSFFMQRIRNATVADYIEEIKFGDEVLFKGKLPILFPEINGEPSYIVISLKARSVQVDFLMQRENLYILCFRTPNTNWLEMTLGPQVFVGSDILLVETGYSSTIVENLTFGRPQLEESIEWLGHNANILRDFPTRGLLQLCRKKVTIIFLYVAEAVRFGPIQTFMAEKMVVMKGLLRFSKEGIPLPEEFIGLIRNWEALSEAMVLPNATNIEQIKENVHKMGMLKDPKARRRLDF